MTSSSFADADHDRLVTDFEFSRQLGGGIEKSIVETSKPWKGGSLSTSVMMFEFGGSRLRDLDFRFRFVLVPDAFGLDEDEVGDGPDEDEVGDGSGVAGACSLAGRPRFGLSAITAPSLR